MLNWAQCHRSKVDNCLSLPPPCSCYGVNIKSQVNGSEVCSLHLRIFLYACELWTLTAAPKPWKWSATARCYTALTKTVLPTKKVCQAPAGNWTRWIPPDYYKEMQSAVVWSYLPCIRSRQNTGKTQWKREEDKAERGRGGKTTSGNGQAQSSPSPRGQWRTGKNGGSLLWNHLWRPSGPHG